MFPIPTIISAEPCSPARALVQRGTLCDRHDPRYSSLPQNEEQWYSWWLQSLVSKQISCSTQRISRYTACARFGFGPAALLSFDADVVW